MYTPQMPLTSPLPPDATGHLPCSLMPLTSPCILMPLISPLPTNATDQSPAPDTETMLP